MNLRILIFLPLLVTSTAAAADLRAAECLTQRPSNAKEYWSFRIVEGKRCWYAGRPGKSKTELRWANRRPSVEERPGAAVLVHPPDDPGALSNTCCWPPLEETFDQRWRDLLSDMAMPFTRWRQPLKDQERFNGD